MSSISKGVAVVTGASSGIGAIYADRLARRGYDLILVARNLARLNDLAEQLRHRTGRIVEIVAADLGNKVELGRLEHLIRSDPRITMLVNNAGIGATASLVNAEVGKMEQMIDLNVTALMRLTYAAAPGFAAREAGAIINIASVSAVGPEMLNGVYGGSKAFVLAFSQSLHKELADKQVQVQVVLPGPTATDFWGTAGSSLDRLPSEIVMSAEAMVDAAMAGFDQQELVTIPSLENDDDWEVYETARRNLLPKIARSVPAARFASLPN